MFLASNEANETEFFRRLLRSVQALAKAKFELTEFWF